MKCVRFSDFVTFRIVFESDACREAQRSDWVLVTRNPQHFHRRIDLCANSIEYCLEPVHKIKIKHLFSL